MTVVVAAFDVDETGTTLNTIIDVVELWAEGDSRGDRELLAAARHAHRVTEPLPDPVR